MSSRPSQAETQGSVQHLDVFDPFDGLAEVANLGFDTLHHAQHLQPHKHDGLFEICCIVGGSVRWRVGAKEYDIRGGQIFCAWPGEEHGGVDDILHPCTLYWLLIRLSSEVPIGFLGLPGTEADALHQGLWHLPRRVFGDGGRAATHFAHLVSLWQRKAPLDVLSARCSLVQLLVEVCHHANHPRERLKYSQPVSEAMQIMAANLAEPLSVPEIARRVKQSTSHFHRVFKAETGQGPGDYYMRTRIGAARRLIVSTELPLVQIALRCGFGSSQYFATCFRRVTGRSPSSFRREMQAQADQSA
jgi:AraC family L-rhamnose operon regulatory protein RhaS